MFLFDSYIWDPKDLNGKKLLYSISNSHMILYDSYYGNPAPFHLLMERIKTNTTVPVSEAHVPNAIVDPEPCSLRQILAELYAFISPASETRE